MKTYIILLLVSSITLFSCKKVLEKEDLTAVSPDIWNNETTATLYLNELYKGTISPLNGFGANASVSDESTTGSTTSADGKLMYGTVGIDEIGNFSLATYTRIRNINIAIDELAKSTLETTVKDKLAAQVCFMRALEYWQLVRLYGGVPLELKPGNPFTDDLNTPRSKTSECIDQIVGDLDKGIASLPASYPTTEIARVTRGAAAALKGRILLFWASPQFNPENLQERWNRAYEANKAAKTLLLQDGRDLQTNFATIFLEEGASNKEAIMVRPYDFGVLQTNSWENSARPRTVGVNGGGLNPTGNLANAFPMSNGKDINDSASGYDAAYFWKNRDPRFSATIVWNGALYAFPGATAPADQVGRKQWHYYFYDSSKPPVLKPVETIATTSTGFYTRKMINPAIPQENASQSGTDWIEIRYAEVLLNLAECANEVGKTEEAYVELRRIRARAGIIVGDGNYGIEAGLAKDPLRVVIMKERQIEFAFEDKRYWDIRRRNMFAENLPGTTNTKLNGTRRFGVKTILKQEYKNDDFVNNIRNNLDIDAQSATYFDIEPLVLENLDINYRQSRTITVNTPNYNFFGIPSSLLGRSPAVKQTKGWGNGDFDPYE